MIKKLLTIIVSVFATVAVVSFVSYGALTKQYTFSSGTVISSSEVNANFDDLFNAIGTQEFTEQNYIANDASQTANMDALDMEVKDNADDISTNKGRVYLVSDDSFGLRTLADSLDEDTITWDSTTGKIKSTFGLPRSYLAGLQLTNHATQSLDIAVGKARATDDDADLVLSTAITKHLGATWAEGTDAGGLDTGAIAAVTGYHVWLIKSATYGTVDALFSTSATSPTYPEYYTKGRRIGWVTTDNTSTIKTFDQWGDNFYFKSPTADIDDTATGTNAKTATLPLPTGIRVNALLNAFYGNAGGRVYFSPTAAADMVPSESDAPLSSMSDGSNTTTSMIQVMTDTSGQIRYRASANSTLKASITGYIDRRGRDD